MPASPEFLHGTGHIWIIKILLKPEAKHFSKSDCHIGVSGKIIINLKHIKTCTKPQCFSGYCIRSVLKNIIYDLSKCICQKYLFPKSPAEAHNPCCKLRNRLPSFQNLLRNIPVLYNRTCNKLGEKSNIQKHMPEIPLCLYFLSVHVDHIG